LTVTSVNVRLRIWDGGLVIADTVHTIDVSVPPHQARDFRTSPMFHDLQRARRARIGEVVPERTWTYDVLSVRARY
jgi:hypothetical protein